VKCDQNRGRLFKTLRVSLSPQQQERGGVVINEGNPIPEQRGFVRQSFAQQSSEPQGFTTEDILWALGIWSAIICLSPVIVFYMLMVA